jgi:hypothetical protein
MKINKRTAFYLILSMVAMSNYQTCASANNYFDGTIKKVKKSIQLTPCAAKKYWDQCIHSATTWGNTKFCGVKKWKIAAVGATAAVLAATRASGKSVDKVTETIGDDNIHSGASLAAPNYALPYALATVLGVPAILALPLAYIYGDKIKTKFKDAKTRLKLKTFKAQVSKMTKYDTDKLLEELGKRVPDQIIKFNEACLEDSSDQAKQSIWDDMENIRKKISIVLKHQNKMKIQQSAAFKAQVAAFKAQVSKMTKDDTDKLLEKLGKRRLEKLEKIRADQNKGLSKTYDNYSTDQSNNAIINSIQDDLHNITGWIRIVSAHQDSFKNEQTHLESNKKIV